MRKLLFALMFLISCCFVSASTCQNITNPNTVITLDSSVNALHDSHCFNNLADNVTIDCQGYSIIGDCDSYMMCDGIKSVMNNTNIYNCDIYGFGYGIQMYDYLGNNDPAPSIYNIHIENVSIDVNIAGDTGIELRSINNLLMKNVYVKDHYDDAIFIVGDTNNLTFDNVTSIGGEYGISFYGNLGASPRTVHNNTLINNSYVSAGNSYVSSAGISFVGIHDWGDNYNTQILNTVINNTGINKPCLRTTIGSMNTILLNDTLIGNKWVENPEADVIFNNSLTGNTWVLNSGVIASSIFNWSDINTDGWADVGSDLPVSSATVGSYWSGNGQDWHPRTLTFVSIPCVESWVADSNICSNNLVLASYHDSNNCGTAVNLSTDNNTYYDCGRSGGSYSQEVVVPNLVNEIIAPMTISRLNIFSRLWHNFLLWIKGLFV